MSTSATLLENYFHLFIPGSSNAAETLFLLHGTGGDEYSLLDIAKMLMPQANILSVRGNVLEGTYNRFFQRYADGTFNQADLKRQTQALKNFIITAAKHYQLNQTKICAIGYSNGANITANLLLTSPQTITTAILFRPTLPAKPAISPNLQTTKVLIVSGTNDQLVQPELATELSTLLKNAEANVKLVWREAGHQLDYQDIDIAHQWLTETVL
ncbi:MAG: alpha/beta hydrolase [Candidatus Buchananbacteria bacterium]|nr:alpha/beta hydrolase [Candidatus Buchananbacteria bacterium]